MNILDFFKQNFYDPIVYKEGYNFFNTTLYAIIYIVFFYYVYKKYIETNRVKIDKYFVLPWIFIIFLPLFTRFFIEFKIINFSYDFLFYTPFLEFIYLIVAVFYLSKWEYIKNNWKKFFNYLIIFSTFYIIFLLLIVFLYGDLSYFIGYFESKQYITFPRPYTFFITFSFYFLIIFYIVKEKFYYIPILSHLFDGIFSFIGIKFQNLSEKHYIPSLMIDNFGDIGLSIFLILKVSLSILITYIIYKESINENVKNLLYLAIAVAAILAAVRGSFIINFYY